MVIKRFVTILNWYPAIVGSPSAIAIDTTSSLSDTTHQKETYMPYMPTEDGYTYVPVNPANLNAYRSSGFNVKLGSTEGPEGSAVHWDGGGVFGDPYVECVEYALRSYDKEKTFKKGNGDDTRGDGKIQDVSTEGPPGLPIGGGMVTAKDKSKYYIPEDTSQTWDAEYLIQLEGAIKIHNFFLSIHESPADHGRREDVEFLFAKKNGYLLKVNLDPQKNNGRKMDLDWTRPIPKEPVVYEWDTDCPVWFKGIEKHFKKYKSQEQIKAEQEQIQAELECSPQQEFRISKCCTFDNFKKSRNYKFILEHDTERQRDIAIMRRHLLYKIENFSENSGYEYARMFSRLELPAQDLSDVIPEKARRAFWQALERTNKIGSAETMKFKGAGELSSTVFRYVREALDLLWLFKLFFYRQVPDKLFHILELGVGHGGFALVLLELLKLNAKEEYRRCAKKDCFGNLHYTLTDLPSVEKLAQLSLWNMLGCKHSKADEDPDGYPSHNSTHIYNYIADPSCPVKVHRWHDKTKNLTEEVTEQNTADITGNNKFKYDLCFANWSFSELSSEKIATTYVDEVFRFCRIVSIRYTKDFGLSKIEFKNGFFPENFFEEYMVGFNETRVQLDRILKHKRHVGDGKWEKYLYHVVGEDVGLGQYPETDGKPNLKKGTTRNESLTGPQFEAKLLHQLNELSAWSTPPKSDQNQLDMERVWLPRIAEAMSSSTPPKKVSIHRRINYPEIRSSTLGADRMVVMIAEDGDRSEGSADSKNSGHSESNARMDHNNLDKYYRKLQEIIHSTGYMWDQTTTEDQVPLGQGVVPQNPYLQGFFVDPQPLHRFLACDLQETPYLATLDSIYRKDIYTLMRDPRYFSIRDYLDLTPEC